MRLLVATDAWSPQVNGVVRTLSALRVELTALGHDVQILSPEGHRSVPLPTYAEIRVSVATPGQIARRLDAIAPPYIHIATEGPIGLWTRRWCVRNGRDFTTSFHTRFPEYIRARLPIPISTTYRYLAWFHNAGRAVMASTEAMAKELNARNFKNVVRWIASIAMTTIPSPRAGSRLQARTIHTAGCGGGRRGCGSRSA